MNSNSLLKVAIKSRKKSFFEGSAFSVSSQNAVGAFDILPGHAHFISVVSNFVKVEKEDGTTENFKVKAGVLRVFDDKVDVYLTVL